MGLNRKPGFSNILATGLNSRRPYSPTTIRVSVQLYSNCREYKFVTVYVTYLNTFQPEWWPTQGHYHHKAVEEFNINFKIRNTIYKKVIFITILLVGEISFLLQVMFVCASNFVIRC